MLHIGFYNTRHFFQTHDSVRVDRLSCRICMSVIFLNTCKIIMLLVSSTIVLQFAYYYNAGDE